MDGVTAAFKNEVQLMIYRKKTVLFFILSLFFPVILIALFHALHPVIGLVAVSSSFPVQMLQIFTVFLIPLFMFLEIADLFPQEVSSRTLKIALLRPISRWGAYFAKFLALTAAVSALLLLLGAVSLVCNLWFGTSAAGSLELSGMVKAYLAAFLSMCSLAALFVFAAQFFRSASGFLIFSILLFMVAKALPFLINGFSFFSITAYTDWYSLWLSHSVTASKLAGTSLFIVSSMVMFLGMGYIFFDRKEI